MGKWILLCLFFLIALIGSVYASKLDANPNIVEQNTNLTINLHPDGSEIDCRGVINHNASGRTEGIFKFNCPYCRCINYSSVDYLIPSSMIGDYYLSIYDYSSGYFIKQNIRVVKNSCSDNLRDNNETDVDCGGERCDKCGLDKNCVKDNDCLSDYCNNGKCAELKSNRNPEKYFEDQVFLISDENWKDVLKAVPLAVYTENSRKTNFPLLIYHREGEMFDFDSGIHFLQIYSPKKLTIFGETPKRLDIVLVENSGSDLKDNSNNYFGAGLDAGDIEKESMNDYYSYWSYFNEVVVSENTYEAGLVASVFASLKNSPLIFEDEIDYSLLKGKKVYLIGNIDRDLVNNIQKIARIEEFSIELAQKEYANLTSSDKIILVNSNDLNIKINEKLSSEKGSQINEIYYKNSLSAPILASAKDEVIIPINAEESKDRMKCEASMIIKNNSEYIKNHLENKILKIFDKKPEYLTIIASPNAIPDSYFTKCHESGFEFRNSLDYEYANLEENNSLKFGRIYGISVSDASAYIARDIFYKELKEKNYGNNSSALFIGHSFSSDMDSVKSQNQMALLSGYDSLCYTGEQRDSCIKKTRVPLDDYLKKQIIIFKDHGFPYKWTGTLKYNEIKFLDFPYVFSHACLTNDFWSGMGKTMGARMIRKGALSYQGAIGIAYADYSENSAINKITSSNISLGELNKKLSEENMFYRQYYLLLGDPLLSFDFKKIEWNENYSEDIDFQEKIDNKIDVSLSVENLKQEYFPDENVSINWIIQNNDDLDEYGYLEIEIFSENYAPKIYRENIYLTGNESLSKEFNFNVLKSMHSGNYTVIIRVLNSAERETDSKKLYFYLNNNETESDIELKSCINENCSEEWRVFDSGERIYLNYNGTIEGGFALVYPDKKINEINLPYDFIPELNGEYILRYNSNPDLELKFIVRDEFYIPVKEICNSNNICDNPENEKNCPQDCIEEDVPVVKTIVINRGWNIISLPLSTIDAYFLDIFSFEKAFEFNSGNLILVNESSLIKSYFPYIAESLVDEKMIVSGNLEQIPELKTGWNVFYYYCNNTQAITDALRYNLEDIEEVQGFDKKAFTFSPGLEEYSDLFELKPNTSYFIKVKNPIKLNIYCENG